jgi:shikimate dehydrogenase
VTAPTAATRVFALLGDPVRHSLSPVFQNAAFRALGLDGVYVALRCASGDVAGVLRGVALAGGGGNVTVPHKALRGAPAAGARVLVVGAGGAATAAVCALARDGAGRIVVLNRSPERARRLCRQFGDNGVEIETAESAESIARESFDLAVNATSLGLREGDALPLPPEKAPAVGAALDLVYSRTGETPWVRAMRAAGVPAADGTEMLLHQGAAAFRRWWGVEPPLAAMREALRGPHPAA